MDGTMVDLLAHPPASQCRHRGFKPGLCVFQLTIKTTSPKKRFKWTVMYLCLFFS